MKIFRKCDMWDEEVDVASEEGFIPKTVQSCKDIINKWVAETNADEELDNVTESDYYYKK